MKRLSQQGFILVVSILLILVMGVMGVLIAYLLGSRAMVSPAELQGMQTFYLAESGLEVATRLLVGQGTVTPLTCSTLTGAAAVTNVSLLGGTFTATAVNNALYSATTTLSAGVTASSNSLPLTSVSGFAAHGRVRVDTEAIDYAAISGSSLIGLTRGASGTTAASHSSGAAVAERICLVNVNAGIPSVAAPNYQRQLQMVVEIVGSGDAWIVGNSRGNNFTLLRWNYPTENVWNDYSFTDSSRDNLNAVSMSSDTNGWAVGQENSNNFTILHWDGSSWSVANVSNACSNQDLRGVTTVSTSEAWAVGRRYRNACANNGPRRYTIMKWNGSAWSLLAPPNIPNDANQNQDLNAVSMLDTSGNGQANIGFAVGNSGTILKYDGLTWTTDNSTTTRDLYGVHVVSSSEAWAVGASGEILRWNGSTWTSQPTPVSHQLNAVRMLDTSGNGTANIGWIAGNSGDILYYNGSSWTLTQSSGSNLAGVDIGTSTSAWTVGASETIWHWDGSTWTTQASPLGGTPALNAISYVPGSIIVPGSLVGSWQQVFR